MAETKIEWADFTFNPWIGCTKVSPACDFCYAERDNKRRKWAVDEAGEPAWGPGAPRRRTSENNWRQPLQWQARYLRDVEKAAAAGEPIPRRLRVFCASLADVFDNEVDEAWRAALFALIKLTPDLDWLLLTKRIGNAAKMLPPHWGGGWPNVLLGISVANQPEAERDIPKLLRTPARRRFLSIEPMVGRVDLWPFIGAGSEDPSIDWVISGGESGPEARPAPGDWYRLLRDQCAMADVPFLFKQWGEHVPLELLPSRGDGIPWRRRASDHQEFWMLAEAGTPLDQCEPVTYVRPGKKEAGRLLDGRTHDGFYL